MSSKFNSYTNPNILVLNAKRTKQRNERNFSLKIEKLYSTAFDDKLIELD